MKMKSLALVSVLFFFFMSTLHAESAEEIIKKANLISYYPGDDARSQMLMKVYSKKSKRPIKKLFSMLKYDIEEGGEQLFFIYFSKPADIRGTTFLVKKKIHEDDIRKLYIPASDKILPIAGSRKQDPFMGSDFTYENISGRHHTKDKHELIGETKIKGVDAYIIMSTPKIKEDKIAKMKSWIAKSNYIPLKVEFYNHENKAYKYYKAGGIKTIQGIPTITKRLMVSTLEGTKTILSLNPKAVKYNSGMSKSIFTERSLKNPPMKYLR